MNADVTPLVMGVLVFVSSLLSLKLGLSVAIIEILLGAIGGYFGLKPEEWMMYLAGFGGRYFLFGKYLQSPPVLLNFYVFPPEASRRPRGLRARGVSPSADVSE
jgi:hypothetical protein